MTPACYGSWVKLPRILEHEIRIFLYTSGPQFHTMNDLPLFDSSPTGYGVLAGRREVNVFSRLVVLLLLVHGDLTFGLFPNLTSWSSFPLLPSLTSNKVKLFLATRLKVLSRKVSRPSNTSSLDTRDTFLSPPLALRKTIIEFYNKYEEIVIRTVQRNY